MNIYEKITKLYKEKSFLELKKEIDLLNDQEGENLKLMILANIFTKNNRDDFSEELSDLAIYIIKSGINTDKTVVFIDPKTKKERNLSLSYLAIMSGDQKALEEILNSGADINKLNDSANLLFFASCFNDEKMACYLIDRGIKIMPEKHASVINIAIATNQIELVKKMIAHNYPFENEGDYVENPVILALKHSEDLANIILDSHFKFDLKKGSMTPLESISIVADQMSYEMFDKIIKKIKRDIEDINYPILNNTPALHILIGKRLTKQIELLLSLGVNPNTRVVVKKENSMIFGQENISGYTPLMYAVFAGFDDIVDVLVRYKADPNINDLVGNSPIYIAKTANKETFISLVKSPLLNMDVTISSNNNEYINPMHFLSQLRGEDAEKAMTEILNRKDIPDLINKPIVSENILINGFTPLLLACSSKNIKMIKALIYNEFIDINYQSPLNGEFAIYELLLNNDNIFDDSAGPNSNKETMKMLDDMGDNIIFNEEEEVNKKKELIKIQKQETFDITLEMIKLGANLDLKVKNKKITKFFYGENKDFLEKQIYPEGKSFLKKIFG